MGVSASKSHLERRNSVIRRSQRKSIYGVKGKTDKIIKSIRKFKGIEENSEYIDLKAKIQHLERDLKHHVKELQPDLRNIHTDALKRTAECYKLLEDKLKENQEKVQQTTMTNVNEEIEDNDDVFLEEALVNEPPQSPNQRQTVQLKLVQVQPIVESPQLNKRLSVMKIGVPVMPGSMMEALNKQHLEHKSEEKVTQIRAHIEEIELEISQFVGKKYGVFYNKIKNQLDSYARDLRTIPIIDEAVAEQIKLCENYIGSCLSFLNEKATTESTDAPVTPVNDNFNPNLSPRSIRTTYI